MLARLRDQRLGRLVERDAAPTGEILDLEFEAASRAEPGNGGRVETEGERVRNLKESGTD